MRMRIGAGLAKVLSYLHNEANPRVIYRDLKPRDVLLSEECHPKISDFGIAISAPSNDRSSSVTVTQLMGTPPYWAPEAPSPTDSLQSPMFTASVCCCWRLSPVLCHWMPDVHVMLMIG
ncbi:receptor-like serine/threonine-protein kinase at3g01300 [Phtheirospermum japonicum]|uniref:Receptor-like serine/threonine-protein kinase at3g01300 n=1 Tax=Phtheirospermum japonicum TaxID=374723 RepID=A0A830CXZ2_9LAMI|nr:receptor-like serine/threonine-protein kinase at3g01300 [Phtheirospermum japonicum]